VSLQYHIAESVGAHLEKGSPTVVSGSMASEHAMTRFLRVTILLIALALAPSLAHAHAGHAHGVEHPALTHEMTLPPAEGPQCPARAGTESGGESVDVNLTEHLAPQKGSSCLYGCCSGVSCSACSALALTEADAPAPLRRKGGFALADPPALPSRDPDGLVRPPRSFA